jgi:hypothetical protein
MRGADHFAPDHGLAAEAAGADVGGAVARARAPADAHAEQHRGAVREPDGRGARQAALVPDH